MQRCGRRQSCATSQDRPRFFSCFRWNLNNFIRPIPRGITQQTIMVMMTNEYMQRSAANTGRKPTEKNLVDSGNSSWSAHIRVYSVESINLPFDSRTVKKKEEATHTTSRYGFVVTSSTNKHSLCPKIVRTTRKNLYRQHNNLRACGSRFVSCAVERPPWAPPYTSKLKTENGPAMHAASATGTTTTNKQI